MAKKYCDCGRAIFVFTPYHGWGTPRDNAHDQCRKCWQSSLDSQRL